MIKLPQDKLETIEVKYQDKVLCKLTSQQVVDAAADEVDGWEKEYDVADLQTRTIKNVCWYDIERAYDVDSDYIDNETELVDFICKWAHYYLAVVLMDSWESEYIRWKK